MMIPYQEAFPVGSQARTKPREELEKFKLEWKFHHPLQQEQLDFSDHISRVEKVSFYHGGDVLYELAGIPGIWHEQCLQKADSRT